MYDVDDAGAGVSSVSDSDHVEYFVLGGALMLAVMGLVLPVVSRRIRPATTPSVSERARPRPHRRAKSHCRRQSARVALDATNGGRKRSVAPPGGTALDGGMVRMTTRHDPIEATRSQGLRARSGIVVSRYQGTVVVTIHGDLDGRRSGDLAYMLADLIDGQGNRSIIVDLRDATATDPQWLSVFTDAAARACQRGTVLTLDGAPVFLDAALRRHGLEPILGSGSDLLDIEQLDP